MEFKFKRNGITLTIKNRIKKKFPVLTVRFDGEKDECVIALFKTNEDAQWFHEVIEEFLKGAKNGI